MPDILQRFKRPEGPLPPSAKLWLVVILIAVVLAVAYIPGDSSPRTSTGAIGVRPGSGADIQRVGQQLDERVAELNRLRAAAAKDQLEVANAKAQAEQAMTLGGSPTGHPQNQLEMDMQRIQLE